MKDIIKKSFYFVIIITVLCGVIYPLSITGITQLCFNDKANGSIVEVNGVEYGSELVGQEFTDDKYLWGRIMDSKTSNLSITSERYMKLIEERIRRIKKSNPEAESKDIPVDLVTASGSGVDPHISYEAAKYQIKRIAKNRNISYIEVQKIIDRFTKNKFLGVFGEKVVNVLMVNLALDGKI